MISDEHVPAADMAEVFAAFAEKRPPVFRGNQ